MSGHNKTTFVEFGKRYLRNGCRKQAEQHIRAKYQDRINGANWVNRGYWELRIQLEIWRACNQVASDEVLYLGRAVTPSHECQDDHQKLSCRHGDTVSPNIE